MTRRGRPRVGVVVEFRLDPTLIEQLDRHAERLELPRAELLRWIVEDYLGSFPRRRRRPPTTTTKIKDTP